MYCIPNGSKGQNNTLFLFLILPKLEKDMYGLELY